MMRSLWTAASGMTTQQMNVDTISNNLANINTVGYKKETAEFKSLLYQTMQKESYDNNGNPKPVGIQVGLGVRNSAISTKYTQGIMLDTGDNLDLAIVGDGFFMVKSPDGDIAYTRNGSFGLAKTADGMIIADSNGNPLLDANGNSIYIDSKYSDVSVNEAGEVMGKDASGHQVNLGIKVGIARFNNPVGLEKLPDSLLKETEASGTAIVNFDNTLLKNYRIRSGYLEGSNVQAVDEIVNLIVAQRAYEMNSKIITATDQMLQQANNLR